MLRAAMRPFLPMLLLLMPAACADQYDPPLSYGRCVSDEFCGLETRCDRVTATATAPGSRGSA